MSYANLNNSLNITSAAGSGAAGAASGAAAAGSAGLWGQAAVTGGAAALTAILQGMYQAEEARKQREQDALKQKSDVVGQYGQNQQHMMQQILAGYKSALGG